MEKRNFAREAKDERKERTFDFINYKKWEYIINWDLKKYLYIRFNLWLITKLTLYFKVIIFWPTIYK